MLLSQRSGPCPIVDRKEWLRQLLTQSLLLSFRYSILLYNVPTYSYLLFIPSESGSCDWIDLSYQNNRHCTNYIFILIAIAVAYIRYGTKLSFPNRIALSVYLIKQIGTMFLWELRCVVAMLGVKRMQLIGLCWQTFLILTTKLVTFWHAVRRILCRGILCLLYVWKKPHLHNSQPK